jgi:HK97 family phage major capsid protein
VFAYRIGNASLVTGLQGNPTWVKQTGTSQHYWTDENPAAAGAESNLTFGIVTATPKTAKALLSYTRQQVLQSVETFEPILTKDLLENDALVIDTAALVGVGTQYQPLGLLNTPGIHAHALGANGRKPEYADLTRLKTLVAKANALALGEGGYLTTPEIQDLLENTPRLGNTIALPIWEGDRAAGYKAAASNQVPSGLTKGASAGNCHALIFGVWSEMFILEWGALEMLVDPYTQSDKDVVRVTTSHLVDVFVRRPQAFAAIKDALAS